jgi:hypothetical protein
LIRICFRVCLRWLCFRVCFRVCLRWLWLFSAFNALLLCLPLRVAKMKKMNQENVIELSRIMRVVRNDIIRTLMKCC